MEAEFEYRAEIDNGGISGTASKVDGRGAASGDRRDDYREKLEGDVRNAGQAVPAADAAGRRPENVPDKAGSAGSPDRDAGERDRVRRTGWEPERGVFFRLQRADREYQNGAEYSDERNESAAFQYDAGGEEENLPLRVDLDCGSDLVRGAVRLGRAVEQMTDDVPQRDASTMPPHIDSKRRKKLRQRETALGHAEDDHEDCRMEQQL